MLLDSIKSQINISMFIYQTGKIKKNRINRIDINIKTNIFIYNGIHSFRYAAQNV